MLKARSPSCGSGAVYDGTFAGALVPGWGVAAALFREAGLPVVDEDADFARRSGSCVVAGWGLAAPRRGDCHILGLRRH